MSSSKASSSSMLHIEAERLRTFSVHRPGKTRWPHPDSFSVTPESLAASGFYYNPSGDADDSARCFLCEKQLGGWEEGDLALEQHLSHTKNGCPFAVLRAVQLARETDEGWYEDEANAWLRDMHSDQAIALRRKTFEIKGYRWPHDRKKGWIPTSANLAAAGFSLQSLKVDDEDTAACVYCGIYLSGWEKTDDPLEEHRRRQTSKPCPFFVYAPGSTETERPVENMPKATSSATSKKKSATRKTPTQPSSAAASESEVEPQPLRKRRTRGGTGRSAPPSEDDEAEVIAQPLRQSRRGAPLAASQRITRSASNDTLAESAKPAKATRKPRARKSKKSQEAEDEPAQVEAETMVEVATQLLEEPASSLSRSRKRPSSAVEVIIEPPKKKKTKSKPAPEVEPELAPGSVTEMHVEVAEEITVPTRQPKAVETPIGNLIDIDIDEEPIGPLLTPIPAETIAALQEENDKPKSEPMPLPPAPTEPLDRHGLTEADRNMTVRKWQQQEAEKAQDRFERQARDRLRAFDEKAASARQLLVDVMGGNQRA